MRRSSESTSFRRAAGMWWSKDWSQGASLTQMIGSSSPKTAPSGSAVSKHRKSTTANSKVAPEAVGAVSAEEVLAEEVLAEEVLAEEVLAEEDLAVAESFRKMGLAVVPYLKGMEYGIRSARPIQRSAQSIVELPSSADIERSCRCYRLGGRRDSLPWLLCLTLTLASGCASVTSRFPKVSKVDSAKSPAGSVTQRLPALADPSDRALEIALEMAQLAEQRGMDREAIMSYLSARKQQPDCPGVAHALAVLYDRSGRVDEAAAEYRRALAENPDDADLICDVGYFQYSTNRFDEAATSYHRALALSPDHRQTKINLALLRAHQGHDDEAMRLFTEAIGPAAARHNLGMIKLRQGDQEAAHKLLTDAADRDPSVAEKSNAVLASLESTQRVDRDSIVGSGSLQLPSEWAQSWE